MDLRLDGVDRLEAGQSETNVRLDRLAAGQVQTNERLDRLEAGQRQLEAGQRELISSVGNIQGRLDQLIPLALGNEERGSAAMPPRPSAGRP